MSTGIPPRTRAEQIAYKAEVMRQQNTRHCLSGLR